MFSAVAILVTRVQVFDESTTGDRHERPEIQFSKQIVSVREIIEGRIEAEVAAYNQSRPEKFQGLIKPTEAEAKFNPARPTKFKPVNPQAQIDVAIKAFESGSLLVLLPRKQAKSLDELVELAPGDEVSFLRLVPLIGG